MRGGFVQNQFTSLDPLALPIDRNSSFCAKVANAQLGPCVALGRSDFHPIKDSCDSAVRQEAGKIADQLLSGRTGLPSVLAVALFEHLEDCMFTTLPVKLQEDTVRLNGGDDLLEYSA